MKKRVKLTIWAHPDAGFLQRVLLIFSRRRISLAKFDFEVSELNQVIYCRLELDADKEIIQKIIRQVENILSVISVIVEAEERQLSISN